MVNKNDIIVPWVNDSKFIISKEDAQIRWNIYCGLVEYIEMLFLMHVLRQNNTFIDVGSNVGIYSILASKVIGAKSISFEPHPNTFKKMIKNFIHKGCFYSIDNKKDLIDARKNQNK